MLRRQDERIKSNTASNYSNYSIWYESKSKILWNWLKQDKATYNHERILNVYIVYEISKNCNISSYPALENCLFGAFSLTKHVDIDQYKYFKYGIGLDRKGEFSFGNGFGRD